jgi:hypothetical protein
MVQHVAHGRQAGLIQRDRSVGSHGSTDSTHVLFDRRRREGSQRAGFQVLGEVV